MKIGTDLKFEVPDVCPKTCAFRDDFLNYGQNSICCRCPVFNCQPDEAMGPMVEPAGFRDDWAAEWEAFFKTGAEPTLPLFQEKTK
jgi:hypothetical protein